MARISSEALTNAVAYAFNEANGNPSKASILRAMKANGFTGRTTAKEVAEELGTFTARKLADCADVTLGAAYKVAATARKIGKETIVVGEQMVKSISSVTEKMKNCLPYNTVEAMLRANGASIPVVYFADTVPTSASTLYQWADSTKTVNRYATVNVYSL